MHKFTYNDQERRLLHNPEELLQSVGVKSGDVFVDIGCNDGFFARPAANIVGKNGIVYGVDIDEDSIQRLLEKAKNENIVNIKARIAKAEKTIFCTSCADIVFFGTVLHDFDDPHQVLKNALQMLKHGGKVVNYDWKKEESPFGPPLKKRISELESAELLERTGFINIESKVVSQYFYQVIAIKP